MLIQFNFKNYRSFKDEMSLDLSATKISEFPYHAVNVGNEKLLKTAVIYGANASGKSNIIRAFHFMTHYVLESFAFGDNTELKSKDKESKVITIPFEFDKESRNDSSVFEVFFIDNGEESPRIYQYGFELQKSEVLKEWLYSKARTARKYRTVFEREGKNVEIILSSLKKYEENINMSLEKESLVISLGAKLKIQQFKKVRDWFYKNEIVDYGDVFENLIRSNILPQDFPDSEEVQNKVVRYFDSFDKSIKGFRIKQTKTENGEKYYTVDSYHKMINENEFATISLNQEASGTLKMLSLYPALDSVLKNGSVLFIDELNANLHPLLVRNLVLTFLNEELNKNNAQLIFTTHDAWLLSCDLFRRDEIWFTEKDANGVSQLYSLVDFKDEVGSKIRKDENYGKNYILGKYGAIPKLKGFDVFKGVNNGDK